MLVSLEWLKDYTDLEIDAQEFCDRMIMTGSNLETCEFTGDDMENVVVGVVKEIKPHPDADKLIICMMDVGDDGLLQIVTGADNLFEGAVVPVALHNSRIPGPLHGQPKQEGGVKIKKGKLRGVESLGMLCGASELGLDDKVCPMFSKDGIWILPEGLTPGEDIRDALELRDYEIDFEITPNRPDCLAMLGMAREAAATFGTELKYPDTQCREEEGNAADYVKVDINSKNCKRYIARIVKDIKVEQSPWWLQRRLIHAGMRPINNIVDITNFVMLEYGQPLHAFDINSISGAHIIVEEAAEGEKFTTLDGSERIMDDTMLMIKDEERSVAIAGVMGGLNSEITEDTNTIIIEAANFAGDSVRSTSKKLAHRTEASARFEKGIDPNMTKDAADRACRLIEMIGAGKVIGGSVDVYPEPEEPKPVKARVSRINSVLGIDISREQMETYLRGLEMTVEGEGDEMIVTAPSVRQDINEEVDIVEEVARMYGYDKMPVTLHKGNSVAGQPIERTYIDIARDTMCAMGATEIQTYSFVSPKGVDNIGIDEDSWERAFVRIKNPLGEENSVMRTILTPNMLEVLGRNSSRSIPYVKAFEIGNTFLADIMDPDGIPEEQYAMCIGMYGNDADFFTLKGMVCELLKVFGITDLDFVPEEDYKVYHPGRCAQIITYEESKATEGLDVLRDMLMSSGDEELQKAAMSGAEITAKGMDAVPLGIMGEVHPDVADKYGIDGRCYVCELFFNVICEMADMKKEYHALPKYPSTSRDIALVVEEDMPVGNIEKIIKENGGDILEDVQLFDIYRGVQAGKGKKSVAFALTYRDENRTLTDEDVAPVHEDILQALSDELGAELRKM